MSIVKEDMLYTKYFKQIFDFIFAVILSIFVLPCILICALIIKFEDPTSPVIYKQPRPGKGCKIFKIYKLRTMKADTYLTDKQRLLKSGEIIRKLSLDELPQIFNILKGEMSFIGPRPLLVSYLDFYTTKENKRHDVLPGITGLAQVNGRNGSSWEKRFELDVLYVDNMSFKMDIKILFKTVIKVLITANINNSNDITMPCFNEYLEEKEGVV